MANDEPMPSGDKLRSLRALFSSSRVTKLTNGHPISAYVLPSTDAHQNEYLADRDFRVRFISGFSGSNAYVIVTDTKALLWTDGRYFIQAGKQMDSNWTLMKQAQPDSILPADWLAANLPSDSYIAFDPCLMKLEEGMSLTSKLSKLGLHGISLEGNLVDEFWTDRPAYSGNKLVVLSDAESGKSVADKLADVRKCAHDKLCTATVFAALDDIMWLLNVRGSDIPHNPLAFSYLLVTPTEAHLFIDNSRLDDNIRQHLSTVTVHTYEEVTGWLANWDSAQLSNKDHRVFVPETTNLAIGKIFDGHMVSGVSPACVAKGVKNIVELDGIRSCSVRDSAALVEFFLWLETELLEGRVFNEFQASDKINAIRAGKDKYMDLSFTTLASAGDHAAMPHYHPEGEDGKRLVTKDQVFLLDSGAHYKDGTTDVTRTVWIGDMSKVPADFVKHNTLVLKGHIHLASTLFPDGIHGIRIDTLSRHAMWQRGLDFGHGTGHGVGHYLNVHEGPAGIGHRMQTPGGEIHAGMILTIEPGYYLPGKWGIRIENVYEVVKAAVESGADNFLTFKSLTLVPIQTNIIDKSMLTNDEVFWLNAYHDRVLSVTGAYLKEKGLQNEFDWLKRSCAHV